MSYKQSHSVLEGKKDAKLQNVSNRIVFFSLLLLPLFPDKILQFGMR